MTEINKIYHGDVFDVLKTFEDNSINCCVTSPPYWGLRDYGVDGQLGLEKTPEEYTQKMVDVFREVRRVLREDGTLWLNLGDSYAGSGGGHSEHHANPGISNSAKRMGDINRAKDRSTDKWSVSKCPAGDGLKPKDIVGIPWRVAFALQKDGWYLRQDIIWHKPNPMPESVTDRCTKSHEYIFLMSKNAKYYYDADAIKEPYTEPMNRWGGNHLVAKTIKCPVCNGGRAIIDCAYCKNKFYITNSNWDKGTGQTTYRDRDMRPDPNGRNKRSVWTVTTKPYSGAHFATFPPDLIEPCILAGCHRGGVVLDPFMGAGTTAVVAKSLGRNYVGIELNQKYIEIAEQRIMNTMGSLL